MIYAAAWLALVGLCHVAGWYRGHRAGMSAEWIEGYHRGWDDAVWWLEQHAVDTRPERGASVRIDQPMKRGAQ